MLTIKSALFSDHILYLLTPCSNESTYFAYSSGNSIVLSSNSRGGSLRSKQSEIVARSNLTKAQEKSINNLGKQVRAFLIIKTFPTYSECGDMCLEPRNRYSTIELEETEYVLHIKSAHDESDDRLSKQTQNLTGISCYLGKECKKLP
jgi:hypothetical protein